MSLIKRIQFVIRASRCGRGEELDALFYSMDKQGAKFTGAKGSMLCALASMNSIEGIIHWNQEHRHLDDDVLGGKFSWKVFRYLKSISNESVIDQDAS